MAEESIYCRSSLLLGADTVAKMSQCRVIVFGVGGVGSWCAEALVRTGITHLTIVDSDEVAVSNINRQLMATTATVGQPKVEVLKERLLQINPAADIEALRLRYSDERYSDFCLDTYDYIVDAIDSLKDKVSLILRACDTKATFFSSMGAALKVNPTGVRVTEFWKVQGCPLAATLRRRFKHLKQFPSRKFMCVYDPEVEENRGEPIYNADGHPINGSLVHITAIFGMTISGLIINDIYSKTRNTTKI